MEGPDLQFTEATIDNGAHGQHVVRFESGLLARQAAGSATVFLDDDTMLLSATTAQSKPRDAIDFFPLTVDVEERMYAAGRIPGSFFRREGRPSRGRHPHLPADRPAAAALLRQGPAQRGPGRRHRDGAEPDKTYDVVAINAASLSTQLAGLPFNGPIGGVRVALIGDQWVGFPDVDQLANVHLRHGGRRPRPRRRRRRDHDGRGRVHRGDLGAGRRRPHRPDRGGRGRRSRGGQAVPQGPLRRAGRAGREVPAKETASFPIFLDYSGRRVRARSPRWPAAELAAGHVDRRQAAPRGVHRDPQGQDQAELGRRVRGSREGDHRRLPGADQEARPAEDPHREGAHRRPRARPTSGPCPPRSPWSRGCTAPRCSSAARPRSWASPP